MTMATEFHLFQQHVATRLGVAEERVRELRGGLKEGEHWIKAGTRILYSSAGEGRLRDLLKVPEPAAACGERGAGSLEQEKEAGVFRVVRCLPNPHYVMAVVAQELAAGELVQVRVRDNSLVMPRMVLECVREASGWVCPRVPRRKGTW